MLALKLRVNPQQRQHVHRVRRDASRDGGMIVQVTTGTAKTGTQHHPQAPGPAFGNAQPSLRRRDQGNADQPILDYQSDGRQFLEKMLLDQFPYRGPHTLLIAGTLGLE
ncbi:hypothetical protein D3C78_1326050 [compost metagenome]